MRRLYLIILISVLSLAVVGGTLTAILVVKNKNHTHEWNDWEVVSAANCTDEGEKIRTCKKCKEVESEIIPAIGHVPSVMPAVNPTCTSTGLSEGSRCSVCGIILTQQSVIEKGAHQPAVRRISEVPPTCTENGSYVDVTYCSVCNVDLSQNQGVLNAIGHNYDYSNIIWEWDGYTSATATVKCLNNQSHTLTVNATVYSNIEDYVRIYKATIVADGVMYYDTRTQDVDYTIVWNWTDDNSGATANFENIPF